MKYAAADPTCRKTISGCTLESARLTPLMFRCAGPKARWVTSLPLGRGRSSRSSRAKESCANNPIPRPSHRSGIDEQSPLLNRLRLGLCQHLAHERVLGEDLDIMLQGRARSRVILQLDEPHN